MKKISLFLTAACALWAFASCCQDKDPMYHRPAENSMVANVPAMQNEYIVLTEGDVLELTTSQPDYGYSAVANYSAQVSLTEDFTDYRTVDVVNNHLAAMQMKQESIAVQYCSLKGIEDPDQWDAMFADGVPFETLYFRAACELEGVQGSYIASNVVAYNYLQPYFAVPTPGYIYLVGSINKENSWNINPGPDMRLYEPDNNIGSGIYSGVFNVEAGDVYFRFYTEIGDWGNDGEFPSFGPRANDGDNEEVEFVDGSFAGTAVPGKGSWFIPGWEGGEITMVVNMSDINNITVQFFTGAQEVFVPEYIWMIGNYAADWTEPSEANAAKLEPYKLATTKSAPDVYSGRFYIPDAYLDLYFRFAYELNGWDGPNGNDPAQWGMIAADQSTDCTFTNNEFTGDYVVGKGAWHFVLPQSGYLNLAVDRSNQTVVYTFEPGAE